MIVEYPASYFTIKTLLCAMNYLSLLHSQFHENFGTDVRCFYISLHFTFQLFSQQNKWDKYPCTNKLWLLHAYSRDLLSSHPLSTTMSTVTVCLRNLALKFRKSESHKPSSLVVAK